MKELSFSQAVNGNFLRFLIDFQLSKNQVALRCPSADHIYGRFAHTTIMRTSEHLAIYGDHLSAKQFEKISEILSDPCD